MSDSSNILQAERLIDQIADRFEAAWRAGQPARLEESLVEAPDDCRTALFQELLAVELQLRRQRGEEPCPADYQSRFAEYGGGILAAFELADDTGDIRSTTPEPSPCLPAAPESPQVCRRFGAGAEPGSEGLQAVEAGASFGRFELLEELGEGGFGTVWKAHDRVLKRLVALKIPRAGRLRPHDASPLMQEARNVARLKHAGVVQVYDAGEESGTTYIASEYIAGSSLRERLRGERLSCRRAAEICLGVAEALHHAHELGIVHRDLKPANILLDESGAAYVADFGLAKSDELETPGGQLVGTASYMAPEQAAGRSSEVDRRSDVYSLGVILYEMVTGRRPFQDEGGEVAGTGETRKAGQARNPTCTNTRAPCAQVQHKDTKPVRPRRVSRAVPRDLEAICLKCLKPAPSDRYATAADLAADLARHLRGEPVAARPLAIPLRLGRWARRRPAIAVLVLLSLSLLAAIVAVGAVSYERTARSLERAETHLYFHRVLSADRAWQANDIPRMKQFLADCPAGRRGWEWGYLSGLPYSSLFAFRAAGGSVAFSPDGKLIATGGGSDWNLKLWDGTTGKKLAELGGHKSHICCVDFSSDGRWLLTAGGRDGTAILWDVAARKAKRVFEGHTDGVVGARFLSDGRRLVTAGKDMSIRIWEAETGEELFRIVHDVNEVRNMAVCPHGRHVALTLGRTGPTARLVLWNLETRQYVGDLPAFDRIVGMAFSPDGARLAAASGRDRVRIWDVASREMVGELPVVPAAQACLAFSPDGRSIALNCWDNSVAVYDAVNGRCKLTLRGHRGDVRVVAFAPDAERIAFGTTADMVYVHQTISEQGTGILQGHEGAVVDLAFVPATPLLLSASRDGTVRAWDVAAGRALRVYGRYEVPVCSVCASPDGATVAAGADDGWIRIWDVRSGKLRLEFQGSADGISGLIYSLDGRQLLSACRRGQPKFWDSQTGRLLRSLDTVRLPHCRIALSPCGRWLATVPRFQRIRVFDAATLHFESRLRHDAKVTGHAFGRSGIFATACNDGSVHFWDLAAGQTVWKLPALEGERENGLVFHPDGTRFVTVMGGETIALWDYEQRQRLLILRENADVRGGVARFSSDGTYLAAACTDASIRVWKSVPEASE
ncbi:MAG: protein kinase [Planctomycetaceae bacterium]|nr:protein kinase [Planctomycetaceae bacterium]